jgi:hypothetical protein
MTLGRSPDNRGSSASCQKARGSKEVTPPPTDGSILMQLREINGKTRLAPVVHGRVHPGRERGDRGHLGRLCDGTLPLLRSSWVFHAGAEAVCNGSGKEYIALGDVLGPGPFRSTCRATACALCTSAPSGGAHVSRGLFKVQQWVLQTEGEARRRHASRRSGRRRRDAKSAKRAYLPCPPEPVVFGGFEKRGLAVVGVVLAQGSSRFQWRGAVL